MHFILFWGLLIWGLYDGDVYPKEAAIMVGIWVLFLIGALLLNVFFIWLIIATVLLDVVLILKVFGQDIKIR